MIQLTRTKWRNTDDIWTDGVQGPSQFASIAAKNDGWRPSYSERLAWLSLSAASPRSGTGTRLAMSCVEENCGQSMLRLMAWFKMPNLTNSTLSPVNKLVRGGYTEVVRTAAPQPGDWGVMTELGWQLRRYCFAGEIVYRCTYHRMYVATPSSRTTHHNMSVARIHAR